MASTHKKVLLMGKSNTGKTSMRSIIFADYIARDTRRLGPTIEATFMDGYLKAQREHIFRNVGVLIYVFDVQSQELDDDILKFEECIEAVTQYSEVCKVFCLVHKMDTIQLEEDRQAKFEQHTQLIRQSTDKYPVEERGGTVKCFRTSIWDETLYRAWSSIVYSLIPNIELLEQQLHSFAEICEADEVVLFEKKTFLVIVRCTVRSAGASLESGAGLQISEHQDVHRFEKISNFIKQFKLSCAKSSAKFSSLEFTAFIESFTSNTYVMVVMSDPEIEASATRININAGRAHFELNGLANEDHK